MPIKYTTDLCDLLSVTNYNIKSQVQKKDINFSSYYFFVLLINTRLHTHKYVILQNNNRA